ncbi:MAG TPA: hypothetical protein VIT24_03245 [Acidimicrobiales bacterium]
MTVTVITDEARATPADAVDGSVLIDPADLPGASGWTLEPEGLCRADVCVPVRDRGALFSGDRLDLGRVAETLDRPFLVDEGVAVLGEARPTRRLATDGLQAPGFTFPDLAGERHALEEWRGRKKLLVAFASW